MSAATLTPAGNRLIFVAAVFAGVRVRGLQQTSLRDRLVAKDNHRLSRNVNLATKTGKSVNLLSHWPHLPENHTDNDEEHHEGLTAICVVGATRTFRFEEIRRGIQAFSRQNHGTLFMHLTLENDCDTSFKAKVHPEWCLNSGWPSELHVEDEFPSARFHWREYSTCHSPEMQNSTCCQQINKADEKAGPFLSYMWTSVCIQEALEYERQNGVRFDWFVRTRPDTLIFDNILLEDLPKNASYVVRHGSKEAGEYDMLGDWFMASPRSHAMKFYDTLTYAFEGMCETLGWPSDKAIIQDTWPEREFIIAADAVGLPVQAASFPVALSRVGSRPKENDAPSEPPEEISANGFFVECWRVGTGTMLDKCVLVDKAGSMLNTMWT